MIFTFVNNVNLLIFIECFCYGQFIAFYFERRKNYLLRVILSFLVFATLTYFIPLVRIENYFVDYLYCIFMYLSILFFTYLTILACVKITWFNGLFFAATSYLLHHSISATICLTCSFAFASVFHCPPSENESGVTLRMPMMSVLPPSTSSLPSAK